MSGLPPSGDRRKNAGWRARSVAKSAQLLVADVVGNLAELAFLRFEEPINKALPFLRDGFKKIMYHPIKIVQKPVEKLLESAGNFEDPELRAKRLSHTEEERLDGLLDAAYDYTAAGAVGLAALMGAERGLSKLTNTPHFSMGMWGVDLMVHTGIVAYMGSERMKPTTEKIKSTFEHFMLNAGWSPEAARKDSTFATVYIVPNYVNWLSNSALAAGMYYGEQKGRWNPDKGLTRNLIELGKSLGIGGGAKTIAAV